MHDCKTMGGHYFVHAPQMRSFNCQRCRASFANYNPPQARTRAAQQWYGDLLNVDTDRAKAPWRCIVESCAFVVCEPCSTHVQTELDRLRKAKNKADEEGVEFDYDEELGKLEVDGPVGFCVDSKANDSSAAAREKEKDGCPPGFQGNAEVDMNMDVDSDGGGYSMEFSKRPFTRSAAAAAASARARARRTTVVRRERGWDRDATGD